MAQVILKRITKRYGDVEAVKDISLEIADKEFYVLVGPSGCGKSTTLRMIAGLETTDEGEIWIGDRMVKDVPPKDRDIAMVFQNYALYPHMTVYDNMSFGLRLRKYPKKEIDDRVCEAGEILNLGPYLKRYPRELSGGQRQRVAVGRAIVRKPQVFLFDEPLSNLDAKLRVQMRIELIKLHQSLKTTMIYVTHDQIEAMTMGDRICVMKDGIIHQVDDPLTLYNKPVNQFVAGFIGSPPMNFIEVYLFEKEGGVWVDEGKIQVRIRPEVEDGVREHLGKRVLLGIRPEDIYDRLFAVGGTEENVVKVSVDVVEPMGAETILYVNTGKNNLIVRADSNSRVLEGQVIELVLNMEKAHLFCKETGQRIV